MGILGNILTSELLANVFLHYFSDINRQINFKNTLIPTLKVL